MSAATAASSREQEGYSMTEQQFRVFDADGHVFEQDNELVEYYEGEYKGAMRLTTFNLMPSLDYWNRALIMQRGDAKPRSNTYTTGEIWSNLLDELQAEGSVLYPSAGLGIGLIQQADWAAATATAYNNWLEDRYHRVDDRLFGAGLLSVQDPDAAVKELRRCATERFNFVAMMLPSVTCLPRYFGDEYFWPIYQEAERLDFPLAFHGGPSRGHGFNYFDDFAKTHALEHPFPLMIQLTDMILSGVFDVFPKLRVAFLEGGCTWVNFMIDRLDYEYDSVFGFKLRQKLKKKPSDYLREGENFYVGVELGERTTKYVVEEIGADKLLYASDYPHEPPEEEILGDVPSFLRDSDLGDEANEKILYHNAKRFYRIDERVAQRAAAE
jgi:predicted TIM-barrel fold metal-dependent hydrolase